MSGGFDEETGSGIGDAFYRAEGAIEGGVPAPRRRRRGNAGGLADLFGTGGVHGAEDAVFEGGIVAAGMDATNAMITSATMAQASHAMDALYETREIAHHEGDWMFAKECRDRLERKYTKLCSSSDNKGPDGSVAASLEECVKHWTMDEKQQSTTLEGQAEFSRNDGTSNGTGGKEGFGFKLSGDGKLVKGEVQVGGETTRSDGETHGTGSKSGTRASTTTTTPSRDSPLRKCDADSEERYHRLFPNTP